MLWVYIFTRVAADMRICISMQMRVEAGILPRGMRKRNESRHICTLNSTLFCKFLKFSFFIHTLHTNFLPPPSKIPKFFDTKTAQSTSIIFSKEVEIFPKKQKNYIFSFDEQKASKCLPIILKN